MQLPHGVRRATDGTVWIPRKNPELEAWLDEHYLRVGNGLRWMYKLDPQFVSIDAWLEEPVENNNTLAYFVGKGKSLDDINSECFPREECPIICINHAIHVIEGLELENPLYAIVQDKGADVRVDLTTTVLAHKEAAIDFSGHPNLIYHDHFVTSYPSTAMALHFFKQAGFSQFHMYCFDYLANGNFRYAQIPNAPVQHHIQILDKHKEIIMDELRNVDYNFLTPRPIM